ncbi:hypothetical protein NC653_034322 [Populus alba x Populus x berolinensis]|uniref:protein-serine/threonine phosphatase n=1 Tax=Populus alba x Populus x berolinensis TaxID=444605 RepID=A0AAD6PWZ6_9ROSI|nr:hypothetical protein NC653_034322 [Populus alba x Populus x berolinensis]
MLCNSCIRSVIVQAGIFRKTRLQLGNIGRSLNASRSINYKWNRQVFLRSSISMMVDSDSSDTRGPTVDLLKEKEDDGGFVSGWWKSLMRFANLNLTSYVIGSEDGELSCGYSSFRGKRVTMEDFYDVKSTTIDGQRVCMFGIFDGHGGSRAAEYLKEHLFENLLKHPQFMADTKLAISQSYQQTDVDFLDSEKDTYRDDGSTASTAVLVGDHLYVANVGDSRTVISKGGKGISDAMSYIFHSTVAIPLSEDHKPNRSDERRRIESAGGVVMWAGTWRVGGVLAMSRAFGNRMLKQFVVAEPDIQDAVSIARTEEEPETAARKLTEAAVTRGSADNITCIVVRLHHDKIDPSNSQQD